MPINNKEMKKKQIIKIENNLVNRTAFAAGVTYGNVNLPVKS